MPSAIFPFEKLAVRTADSAQYREAMKGKLATGESLEVHEQRWRPAARRIRRTITRTPKCG